MKKLLSLSQKQSMKFSLYGVATPRMLGFFVTPYKRWQSGAGLQVIDMKQGARSEV